MDGIKQSKIEISGAIEENSSNQKDFDCENSSYYEKSSRRSDRIKVIETKKQLHKELDLAEKIKKYHDLHHHNHDSNSSDMTETHTPNIQSSDSEQTLNSDTGVCDQSEDSSNKSSPILNKNDSLIGLKQLDSPTNNNTIPSNEICVNELSSLYEHIDENIYLFKKKKTKFNKVAKRLVCDCSTSEQERQMGIPACGNNCLNRLIMIECGSRCPCGEYCTNKNFKYKNNAKIQLFKTDMKGYGIKSANDLKSNTFLVEYVGEVVGLKEFKRRCQKYSEQNNKHFYFMSLHNDLFIDATKKGNISRFFNHSCDPNCETQKWTVNGELRIGFFTKRPVSANEELTFDYQFQTVGKEQQKCYCGSEKCRGYLGVSSKDGSNNLTGALNHIWEESYDDDIEDECSSNEEDKENRNINDINVDGNKLKLIHSQSFYKRKKDSEIHKNRCEKKFKKRRFNKDFELYGQIKNIDYNNQLANQNELFEEWNNLKQAFKIPKKQRDEDRKERERELNSNNGVHQSNKTHLSINLSLREKYSNEKNFRDRDFKSRYRYRYRSIKNIRHSYDRFSNHRNFKQTSPFSEQKNLTKEQRRQLFEQKIKQEEEAAAAAAAQAVQEAERKASEPVSLIQPQKFCSIFDNQTQLQSSNTQYDVDKASQNFSIPIKTCNQTNVQHNNLINGINLAESHLNDLKQAVEHFMPEMKKTIIEKVTDHSPTSPILKNSSKISNTKRIYPSISTISAKLPPNWKCKKTDKGIFYYNIKTRKSQWHYPYANSSNNHTLSKRNYSELDKKANMNDSLTKEDKKTKDESVNSATIEANHKEKECDQRIQVQSSIVASDSTFSDAFKICKDQFREKLSKLIIKILNPYLKNDCIIGRIQNKDDFKHLARKFTHIIMEKEMSRATKIEELDLNKRIKLKSQEFITRYMQQFHGSYSRKTDDLNQN